MIKKMKLLIVDDESATRNGLRKYVAWDKLGINDIECAENGAAALQICKEFEPDIVLSDIRMPGMDGIGLCHELRKSYPNCQIVFLSGYSDKEYLKAAIDLQAIGYVEKPVDALEVEQMIRKALQVCYKNQERLLRENALGENLELLRYRLVKDLITTHPKEEWDRIADDLRMVKMDTEENLLYRVIVIKTEKKVSDPGKALMKLEKELEETGCRLHQLSAGKDEYHSIMIFGSPSRLELSESSRLLQRLEYFAGQSTVEDSPVFIAAGTIVRSLPEIPSSYQTAVIALQALFFQGYRKLRIYQENPQQSLSFEREQLVNSFSQTLFQFDLETAARILQNAYETLRRCDSVMPTTIRSVYKDIINHMLQARRNWNNSEKDMIWEQIDSIDTLRGLHDFTCELLQKLKNSANEKGELSLITRKVINRIRKDYMREDLTLGELAEEAYVTSTYLSNLFKKETGLTIGQYITKMRMEHACNMLEAPKCLLVQVAQECGYSDASYFTKIFKKTIGMTPSQYREKVWSK